MGLTIYRDIFKFQKYETISVIKRTYRYLCSSSKELFKKIQRLYGKKNNFLQKKELANTFNTFFTDNIEKLDPQLDEFTTHSIPISTAVLPGTLTPVTSL